MSIRGIVFDVGGVVVESAGPVLARFEADHKLPPGFLSDVVAKTVSRADGPLQRLERGEILLDEFCRILDFEFSELGHQVSTAAIMQEMYRAMTVRPEVLEAVDKLRDKGFKTAAITNNWRPDEEESALVKILEPHFDLILESSAVGMRKPDLAIYEHLCEQLELEPAEIAYLDERGANLKPARRMGMNTIKVVDPREGLEALNAVLGLLDPDPGAPAEGAGDQQ